MTTVSLSLPSGQQVTLTQLPDPPKAPDAMQQYQEHVSVGYVLTSHFHDRPDVLVSGEGYLCYDASDVRRGPHPDCLVAFGMTIPPRTIASVANGYVISELGKPPDFVLEIASPSTGRRDYTVKRDQYMAYQVGELWRFDATGGRYHNAALAGDLRQPDGSYAPAVVTHGADGVIRAYSPALDLELHWYDHRLRFWDPQTQEYLPDLVEALEALAAERAARQDAEARSILDRAARADAEARANEERAARQDAEIARADAEARAAEAQELIRRLQQKLRGDGS